MRATMSAQRAWAARSGVRAVLLTLLILPDMAFAYRPFDGTDAAVAEPGEMEVECQPAGLLWSNDQRTLVAPATVLNFGLVKNWEAVFEGRVETPLSPSGPTSLTDAGAFLKGVLRPGVLQDQAGPSIATEFGALLPDSIDNSRFGASVAAIILPRWDWGPAPFNVAAPLARAHHGDFFTRIILEGPVKWTVRPVAEFFYEEEFGQVRTYSALIGAIWQVREDLSFDVGLRHAIVNGGNVNEIRAGLTIGFPLRQLMGPMRK